MNAKSLCFALVLACTSCHDPKLDKALSTIANFVSAASEVHMGAFRASLALCSDDACVSRVEATYKPFIEASDAMRKVWCELTDDPKGSGCEP